VVRLKHWKFVGWVESIDTVGNLWVQRVVKSTFFGEEELDIEWHLTTIPLPDGVQEGTFISVHRTKAGKWYAVNLSRRMPVITESDMKRVEAKAKQMRRHLGLDVEDARNRRPTIG
jgi:hypothetical protein